ncbi:MAG: extracellular solute-binding protein [Anaerolineae bacterium]|nr:extracellular solute-binding protein [Anaerolineae bacterium]
MKRRSLWLMTLIVVAVSLALFGCQAPAATEEPMEEEPMEEEVMEEEPMEEEAAAEEPAAEEPAEEMAEPVTISVWHGYTETEETTFSQAANDFMAAHPEIVVELLAVPFDELQNKYQTEAATGGGPTLIPGPQDRMAGYAEAGLLATIDENAAFLGDLVSAAVEGGKVGGVLVGVPLNNKVVALFYNKSMVDTPPADFDELLAQAADSGLAITADWFHNYMWGPAFGAQFFDADLKVVIDSAEGAEAYAYLNTVCDSPGVTCDGNDGDMDTLFRQGEVAFRIQGPWASGDFVTDLGADNVGVMAIPMIPGKDYPRPWNQSEMMSINVNATEEEAAAAMAFIEYLTGTEVQKAFLDAANWIPSNASVDTSSNPVVGGFLEQVPYSDPFPVVTELGATWEPMGNAMTEILEEVKTPEEALAEAASLINTANGK